MACRMLVATGQLPVARLLDDFKRMAQNRNAEHELNRNNLDFIHGDGWGIVLGRSSTLELYKNDVACWKDSKYSKYREAEADFVLLHARRASPGSPKDLGHTHPFKRENWYFCHNGTIRGFRSNKMGDSELFFSLILDNLRKLEDVKEAVKNAVNEVKEIKDYTAFNFILANNSKASVLVKYKQNPRYYTMKYLQNENYAIVSSEKLQSFHGEWIKMDNNALLVLDIADRKLEVTPI